MLGPLSFTELLFILVLALLVFGPRKLPEVGRTLGRGLSEFRKASAEFHRTLNLKAMEAELRDADPRRILKGEFTDPAEAKEPSETPEMRETAGTPEGEAPSTETGESSEVRAEAQEATVPRGALQAETASSAPGEPEAATPTVDDPDPA